MTAGLEAICNEIFSASVINDHVIWAVESGIATPYAAQFTCFQGIFEQLDKDKRICK